MRGKNLYYYKKDLENGLFHSKGEMSQASDKWKFLQQKQNHCYLKTCIWVILFCSWVQGGYCYNLVLGHNSHRCSVPTSIKSFWGSQTYTRDKLQTCKIEMNVEIHLNGKGKRYTTRVSVCSHQREQVKKHLATTGSPLTCWVSATDF